MNLKDKIRPTYSELQGCLSQAPVAKNPSDSTDDKTLWELFNITIDDLDKITGNDYNKYKISPNTQRVEGYPNGITDIKISEYRTKLGGLISRLHGEFFYDEPAPFSGVPSTVVTQNQNQQQSTYITMLLEIQDKINAQLPETKTEEEKNFLQTVKSSLSTIKNATELIQIILNTANTFGIGIDKLQQIFK